MTQFPKHVSSFVWDFEFWSLVIVSSFDIRISNLSNPSSYFFQKSYGPFSTVGISLKFSMGGGEEICHSSVAPPHGLSSPFSPPKRAKSRLPKKKIRPVIKIHDPI